MLLVAAMATEVSLPLLRVFAAPVHSSSYHQHRLIESRAIKSHNKLRRFLEGPRNGNWRKETFKPMKTEKSNLHWGIACGSDDQESLLLRLLQAEVEAIDRSESPPACFCSTDAAKSIVIAPSPTSFDGQKIDKMGGRERGTC